MVIKATYNRFRGCQSRVNDLLVHLAIHGSEMWVEMEMVSDVAKLADSLNEKFKLEFAARCEKGCHYLTFGKTTMDGDFHLIGLIWI